MLCKKRVRISIRFEGHTYDIDAELHPKGCMGASRTHLDLPENRLPMMLVEAARGRGMRFSWTRRGRCIVLEAPPLPPIELCGDLPTPRAPPLLRRLKPGRVYLGL